MKMSDLKRLYGDEYPKAVIMDGMRLALRSERPFSRSYHSQERKMGAEISRFMDGSASITASELQQEWPSWTDDIRIDFCQSCSWLHEQLDFPEMLRFIMQHGKPEHWSGIALSVASQLPRDEAFGTLVRALSGGELKHSSNICQAISHTKHPNADATLRRHLATLWSHPSLWEDADFTNWAAFDVATCIAHLIELGAAPTDFTEQVRRLSEHACAGNRRSCRNFLSKHYSWLK
ncbi:MAG TPA: hypothetical protein VEH04_01505 [Verrucomicrobiae bacterium]|nr:hypothetical protein [Verrucomicrobiae bacterium]